MTLYLLGKMKRRKLFEEGYFSCLFIYTELSVEPTAVGVLALHHCSVFSSPKEKDRELLFLHHYAHLFLKQWYLY